MICLLLTILLLSMDNMNAKYSVGQDKYNNNNQYSSNAGGGLAGVMSSTCNDECVINEKAYDQFPGEGDSWSINYLKKMKTVVASQKATLGCDLSQMDLPLEFVKINSGDSSYK
ncbi:hypothetical protein HDU76_005194, partial [Blyttiomyces sp. JEL0837]